MTTALPSMTQLLDHAAGRTVEPTSKAASTQLLLSAGSAGLLAASFWGMAVGSSELTLALANAWKVPAVLALSSAAALPPALLSLRLSASSLGPRALVASCVRAAFAATMWLGVLAPLIGLYLYTSSWAGPMIAMGSGWFAVVMGIRVLAQSLGREVTDRESRRAARVSGAIWCVLQLLILWQLLVIVSPILPTGSMWSQGIDGLLR